MAKAIHLPDEIISEILSPALRVSDEAFSYISTISSFSNIKSASPFMTFTESTSALLVVCKAWLRVSTPLLYHTVVLRSKAQAQALAATLKANPDLGTFIKRLRVEGGFAISMLKILQSSPNITDLFLSVQFASGDNACGLCRGLALLDPVRVIVAKATLWGPISKEALKLLQTLEKCVLKWKKLAIFEFPESLCERTDIPKGLSQAPNLATFVILDPEFFLQRVAGYMELVATNPSLKRIRINPVEAPYDSHHRTAFYGQVERNKKLNALFDRDVVADPPSDLTQIDHLPSTTPFVYPARLAADSVQEDAIWSRVLCFALYNDTSKPKSLSYRRPSLATPLLVCKSFARLGIPHLYETPVLNSMTALNSFASELGLKPILSHYIQGLTLKIDPMGASFFERFETVVASIPKLRELNATHAFPLRWDAFCALAECTGSSMELLRGISIPHRGAANPLVFTSFPRLRELEWYSNATFTDKPEVDTFTSLVKLTVTTSDPSFLTLLSQMELPSLQTVEFPAGSTGGACFFQKHGGKLCDLALSTFQLGDPALAIWRNCPSMKTLHVCCGSKFPTIFSLCTTGQTHTTLERIVFKVPSYLHHGQSQKKALKKVMTSLLASLSSFPALRDITHPACVWPTSEPEILKSSWVKWAESFLEQGIHLVGPDSVRWRPRLKFVTKSKK
ncbi:hypothetical protein B0H16DRAFT_1885986 [Mycena metata]|uniref:Uncharacterized protein n=1 Tax=Mycena metata TaxID=1033252 RepID=A0AAD7NDL8_9AGAR|nr:hypothetical protein B0H16DRAFT_1885986 [Mycena metata]